MTKKEAVKQFHKDTPRSLYEMWGRLTWRRGESVLRVDSEIKNKLWGKFVRKLYRKKRITQKQANTWCNPF